MDIDSKDRELHLSRIRCDQNEVEHIGKGRKSGVREGVATINVGTLWRQRTVDGGVRR